MNFAPQEQRAHSPRLAAAFFPLARTITDASSRTTTRLNVFKDKRNVMTKRNEAAKAPLRIRQRPSPGEWSEDELMSLPEAASLFWPDGPLTTTSLRTAVRDGLLDVALIAGKLLTTKSAVLRMSECRPRNAAAARPAASEIANRTLAALRRFKDG
jgi:hypothetical protein